MIQLNIDTITKIIHLVLQNNIIIDNNILSLISQNPMNQKNNFLQKKRILEHNENNNNQNINQEDINCDIADKNNIQSNEYSDNYRQQYIYGNVSKYGNISNLKEIEYNKYITNKINFFNKENNLYNYLINNNVNNITFNFNGNKLDDFPNNRFSFDNKKRDNKDNIKENYNSIHYKNSKYSKKEKFYKEIKKKCINKNENNNEIKVIKNNKIVYINKSLLNSNSASKKIKKINKVSFIRYYKRSSKFRGVSKNGNQWQVLIMFNRNKSYIGSYPNEEIAARIYDILALKNRGVKARTNFTYNCMQIKKICETDLDIKSKNLFEIVSQLIE